MYALNKSPANSAASSPPVPARISKNIFLSSFGSFGRSKILISSSSFSLEISKFLSSSFASSPSSESSSKALFSSMSFRICRYFFAAVATGSIDDCSFESFVIFSISFAIFGSLRSVEISS